MVAQKNRCRADAALLGNLDDGLSGEQRASRAAERAVGDYVDALGGAEVDDFLLRQAGVVLDLVDGGDDAAAGEQLLEVFLAVLVAWSEYKRGDEEARGKKGWNLRC